MLDYPVIPASECGVPFYKNQPLCYNVVMATLTIPKSLSINDDLVVLSRKEYESLTRIARHTPAKTPSMKKLPAWLRASIQEDAEGDVAGPFHSVEELMKDLRA